ncbi:transcription factor Tfb2-domain-containing protein [Cryomyces antarcticus]
MAQPQLNPSSSEKDQALNVLERLHILPSSARAYKLSDSFAASLRLALTGGGNHRSFGVPCSTPDKHQVSIDFLDAYAQRQWETILYYVVSSAGTGMEGGIEISNGSKTLLKLGNFVVEKARRPTITQMGFEFLLQETNGQVWNLLIVYLDNAENLKMDPVDVLSFLFTLGSLTLGQDYSTANLSPTQIQMLEDLADFGLIYRRSPDSIRYYPTRLATTLTSDAPALLTSTAGPSASSSLAAATSERSGFIIVETNYRIYAYTTSPLTTAILALFTHLTIRFPNMVAGKLTKESVQTAITYGITADQIVSYLTTHAHPQLHKTHPVLPPTVVDQIRLWQIEGDRMRATPGFLFKEFAGEEEYKGAVEYADTLGVLVWRNDGKRLFFVTRYEQLMGYFRNKPKKGAGAGAGAGAAG